MTEALIMTIFMFTGIILTGPSLSVYLVSLGKPLSGFLWMIATYAGFLGFLMLVANLVENQQAPIWVLEVFSVSILTGPWFFSLWFIQLWLIEDRRKADRVMQPTTTEPARRVVEQPEV